MASTSSGNTRPRSTLGGTQCSSARSLLVRKGIAAHPWRIAKILSVFGGSVNRNSRASQQRRHDRLCAQPADENPQYDESDVATEVHVPASPHGWLVRRGWRSRLRAPH